VRVNSKVIRVEKQGNSIAAKIESIGRISEIAGTHMLVATGRRPNTDDLGLDKAGIATDARGYIQVDDQLRTNSSGIWAMGDCNGRGGPVGEGFLAVDPNAFPADFATDAPEPVARFLAIPRYRLQVRHLARRPRSRPGNKNRATPWSPNKIG
jgi:NADPH-dependent 2,4-dienoyl-CoA reductase/sulfur reductase-like enzyme